MPHATQKLIRKNVMIAKTDTRVKLLISILFSIITILISNTLAQILCLFSAFILYFISKVSLAQILKPLLAVNIFMAFAWLTLLWQLSFHSSQIIISYNPDGLLLALSITLKSNAILIAWRSLLYHDDINSLLQALASWHIPDKLLVIIYLVFRYGLLINEEYKRLERAMRMRGFKLKLSWHGLRSFSHLLATLLIKSFDRAERVYLAMLCRGFTGKFYYYSNLRWQRSDFVFLTVSVSWLCLLLLGSKLYL